MTHTNLFIYHLRQEKERTIQDVVLSERRGRLEGQFTSQLHS